MSGRSGESTPEETLTLIRPSRAWTLPSARELWAYRELFYLLAWRNISVRYKQTAIGIAWVVIQPLAMVLVFTLFFGRLADLDSDGMPYPLFALAALLPWQLFSRTFTESSSSLVTDQTLITRAYFPRIIIPVASVLAAAVDVVVASVLMLLMMAYYGVAPGIELVWLPAFVMLMLLTAVGVGLWLSALNVQYRDVRYVVPFLAQLWMFVTPVVYSSSLVPERWRLVYGLNPMAGVVDGFRWALLGSGDGPGAMVGASAVVAVVLFLTGLVWFKRLERTFADTLGAGIR